MTFKQVVQFLLFIVGVSILFFVVKAVGLQSLSAIFPALSGWGWLVFLIYPIMCFWDVIGWKVLFDKQWKSHLKLWELYWIRMAGEAVNNITPFIDIAGEFLKVVLCEKRLGISKKSALAAGVMSRSCLLFSEIIFVLTGIILAGFISPIPGDLRNVLLIALVGCFVAAVLLIITSKKGLFTTFIKLFERFGIDPKILSRFHTSLQTVDEEMSRFYTHDRKRLALGIFLHLLGWVAGGLEVFVMLRLLGIQANLVEGIVLEAMIQLIRTSSFFIPGNLGVQEGGLALILGFMGVEPSLGVVLSIMKRVRQIIWTAIGFFVWGIYQLLELKLLKLKG